MAAIAAILLPSLGHSKNGSGRIHCVNNLKYIGLAFRIFATDNSGSYPWHVSTNVAGSAEIPLDVDKIWKQFVVISNELSSPKILVCWNDSRQIAVNFRNFGNTNLSYFLGLEADDRIPQTILAGDRNLTTNGVAVGPGLLRLGTNQNAGFTRKIHQGAGNILLADGSVQQVTSWRLQESVVNAAMASTNIINRLLIP
ncbi:MAG TPA: H-X9-DG-CTERM domain-containing protein [Candidatus Limnocylindria bacterium]|nr:H-X9-DG-CTERM domain-containing protein [Candidatus Limnocylindria bacterium]